VRERLPTCREIVETITDYLEGSMPPDERERFAQHLAYCDACRVYLAQMRETIRLTGRIAEESLSQETRGRLIQAFRDWTR
jgi:anti-sigma factor RsiW